MPTRTRRLPPAGTSNWRGNTTRSFDSTYTSFAFSSCVHFITATWKDTGEELELVTVKEADFVLAVRSARSGDTLNEAAWAEPAAKTPTRRSVASLMAASLRADGHDHGVEEPAHRDVVVVRALHLGL